MKSCSQKQVYPVHFRCTLKPSESTRQEPCDWLASHRTFFWLETGQVHLETSTSSGSQLFMSYFDPVRGHALFPYTSYTNATTFAVVGFCGKRPTLAASPHHDPPHRLYILSAHTLVYSTMHTDGKAACLPHAESSWAQFLVR